MRSLTSGRHSRPLELRQVSTHATTAPIIIKRKDTFFYYTNAHTKISTQKDNIHLLHEGQKKLPHPQSERGEETKDSLRSLTAGFEQAITDFRTERRFLDPKVRYTGRLTTRLPDPVATLLPTLDLLAASRTF